MGVLSPSEVAELMRETDFAWEESTVVGIFYFVRVSDKVY